MPQISLDAARDKHVYISVWLHSVRNFVPVGAVTFNENLGFAGFSYFEEYIAANHPPLNPATLNYRDTKLRHFVIDPKSNSQMLDRTFWELLPTQGDFGTNILISRHPQYQGFNNAQKLHYLGTRVVGGLSSYVRKFADEQNIDSSQALDDARREAVAFQLREIARVRNIASIDALTSYGGVRPKAMFKDNEGRLWIAKFNLPTDPYDMAKAEQVAMLMAKDSGLTVPETRVLELPSGENAFLTERFDRKGEERFHSLSLFALAPGIDPERKLIGAAPGAKGTMSAVMATIIRRYSDFKDADTTNLVCKLLVDVGFNNTDNHLRNTRLILNASAKWELTPTFDIIFNPRSNPHIYNPGGLDLANTFLTNEELAKGIAAQTGAPLDMVMAQRDRVLSVVENAERYCHQVNMSPEDIQKIQAACSLGTRRIEPDFKLALEQRAKIEQAIRMAPKPKPNF